VPKRYFKNGFAAKNVVAKEYVTYAIQKTSKIL